MPSRPAEAGAWAELAALEYLEHAGLKLITRNYRCRVGELDLIMEDRSALVFVEVRLRNHAGFGSGGASVTHGKQRKLVRAAGMFLLRNPKYRNRPCRFDVVSVSKPNYRADCEWIQDAFA